MTTKILALTDRLGRLVRFVLLPGQRYDNVGVASLIDGLKFRGLIADKAFDAAWIIKEMNRRDARICISQDPNRKAPVAIDLELHKSRHLIENFFGKIKEFKRIALPADKTDASFQAIIYAAVAAIETQRISTDPSARM